MTFLKQSLIRDSFLPFQSLFLAVAMMFLAASSPAHATKIRVLQESTPGAGDFNANVLGVVQVYSVSAIGSENNYDFYRYGDPFSQSYNGDVYGGPAPLDGGVVTFFVQNSTGQLSLFNVLDRPTYSFEPGNETKVELFWDLQGDKAEFQLLDDGGSSTKKYELNPSTGLYETTLSDVEDVFVFAETSSANDAYALEQTANSTVIATRHRMFGCCGDGYVVGHLDNDWTLTGYVNYLEAENEAGPFAPEWRAASANGNQISLSYDTGRRVLFSIVVPEPSTLLLVCSAVGAVLGFRRR